MWARPAEGSGKHWADERGGRGQWSERARSTGGRRGAAADGGVGENCEVVQGQNGGAPAFGGEEETLEVPLAGALRKQNQFLPERSCPEGRVGQPPGGT